MLWTIFVILMILWLLGFATGTTFGGLVHLLILVALVLLIYNLLTVRRIVH
ncbi:MAG TPA: lmo0937 family membrane protein [Terriglobales bacterium]|nr:lmo0937 family membrane protein [Terriglobales bacterium]